MDVFGSIVISTQSLLFFSLAKLLDDLMMLSQAVQIYASKDSTSDFTSDTYNQGEIVNQRA